MSAAFVAEMISTGCCFSAYGIFVVPLSVELDASRGTISAGPGKPWS